MPFKPNTTQLKRYVPKSLFGRAMLIIILPIAIMQIAVAYIFFNAHWQTVTSSLSESVAADISVAVELYKQAPDAERAERLDNMLRPNMELSVALEQGDALPPTSRNAFFSNLDNTLRRALTDNLDDPFWFDTTRYPNHIDIRVEVDAGVLRFIAPRERVFAPTGLAFLFWLLMATTLLTLISILFIREQARPISELAGAADAFGRGQDIGSYKPSGASEVRLAGQSFLKMRQRLRRYIDQRTLMLAGVSHDLRTPLTRLKLHLAMQEKDAENDAARRDIKDMEAMLDGYLDFARSDSEEASQPTDMEDFLKTVIDSYDAPLPELIISTGPETLDIKPIALQRAIANLISNARKYGQSVRVELTREKSDLCIHIDDDGPGIPEDQRREAFRPFSRLDTARNQNIKGTGLGLAIARDIVQGHGGSLTLHDSDMGGLRATIRLPH